MNNIRTCVLSRVKKNKSELLKITKKKDGMVIIDSEQKINGRSCYIDKKCFDKQKIVKGKFLQRHLKISNVQEELYERLEELCK
jgi:predicted RNA-binding protein YlxR (DUF448 family)